MLTYLMLYFNTLLWFKVVFLYQTPNASGILEWLLGDLLIPNMFKPNHTSRQSLSA